MYLKLLDYEGPLISYREEWNNYCTYFAPFAYIVDLHPIGGGVAPHPPLGIIIFLLSVNFKRLVIVLSVLLACDAIFL